jgi:hypothetical protein
MSDRPTAPRKERLLWILFVALLIGIEGARVVHGDQLLLALTQVR